MGYGKKIGIIGVGKVGSALAYSLATRGVCGHLVLKAVRSNIAKAMALDISQAVNACKSNTFLSVAEHGSELQGCNIILITAGAPRQPGMSRDDLLLKNAQVMKDVFDDIKIYAPNAIIIVVSNPLDALVYASIKLSNFSRKKVIGMAGILDSARMSHFIMEKLGYGLGQIESLVIGGHGNDMVPLPKFSAVAGMPATGLLSKSDIEDVMEKTRNGGLEIVELLKTGSAFHAPARAAAIMVEAILQNHRRVYPCSMLLDGEYGHEDVAIGVPVILGKNGVERVVELNLDKKDKEKFDTSVKSAKNLVNILNEKFFVS